MRVDPAELGKFTAVPAPAPPAIEPVLAAVEEARLIASRPTDDPTVGARRRRVLALVRRHAPPEGGDAELVVLLAAAGALPLERAEDRLRARQRLVEIGRNPDPPPEVDKLLRKLGISRGDGGALAEALLPPSRTTGDFHESGVGFADP